MNGALKLYSKCLSANPRRKFPIFAKAQQGLIKRVRKEMDYPRQGPTIWFHAASLGEYQVARPLISRLKKMGPCTIVMTFFSPSGYRALENSHPEIDHLFYLPLDTAHNARAFIDAVSPDKAVFIISEYWPNILQELKFQAIPTYLVSAIIREDSQFFRWYGRTYRRALSAFSRIFVLNESSRFNLRMLGYTDVSLSGDPLFDNASLVAATPWTDETIERFKDGRQLFVAGSISDDKDLEIVSRLVRENPETKFLLVPHDINESTLRQLDSAIGQPVLRYSSAVADTDLAQQRIMVLDTVGRLAFVYRYATWAYVGGGFTPLLHSVIEATVYGVPVSFGPMIHRKVTPLQMIERGIGTMVSTPDEAARWLAGLKDNPEALAKIKADSLRYVEENLGAAHELIQVISNGLWQKK